jgi:GH24 family phage-related lysozyme (muramidase)
LVASELTSQATGFAWVDGWESLQNEHSVKSSVIGLGKTNHPPHTRMQVTKRNLAFRECAAASQWRSKQKSMRYKASSNWFPALVSWLFGIHVTVQVSGIHVRHSSSAFFSGIHV